MEYIFEKLHGEDVYQVRLNGEFVTYCSKADPAKIDGILFARGYTSREDFFRQQMQDLKHSLMRRE